MGEELEPHRLIEEHDDGAMEGMRRIATDCPRRKILAFEFACNRLEGNAPSTIEAVVEGLMI